jgi:hypothetical protein
MTIRKRLLAKLKEAKDELWRLMHQRLAAVVRIRWSFGTLATAERANLQQLLCAAAWSNGQTDERVRKSLDPRFSRMSVMSSNPLRIHLFDARKE